MKNYFKGFVISFLLHGAALALALLFAIDGVKAEPELLIVDFSGVSVGRPQEGGALPGAGAGRETPKAGKDKDEPAPQQIHPEASPAEPPVEPKVIPAPSRAINACDGCLTAGKARLQPSRGKDSDESLQSISSVKCSKETVLAKQKPKPGKTDEQKAQQQKGREDILPAAGSGGGTESASRSATATGGTPGARGTGPGGGTGGESGLAQGYLKSNFNYILTRIRRNLDYPSQARRMGLAGVSKYSFIIKPDGNIEDVRLEESSGHHILDEAARRAILRAAPFPAPPVPARIIIPISFRLT